MQDDKRQMGSFRCVVVAVTGSVAKAADCARHAAIRCVLGNDSRSDFSIDVVIRRFVLMRIPMSASGAVANDRRREKHSDRLGCRQAVTAVDASQGHLDARFW